MYFLEVNDWQLTAWDERGDRLLQQPAAASTATGELTFGDAALRFSRSHPQQFNNRYLYSLAADPVSGDLGPAKNHADLIYHHLRHLELPGDEAVALCVAGHLTNQQLGLLLGICQEAQIKIAGFIDSALAQSLSVPASGDYHVLDIELHRLCLSHISVSPRRREMVQAVTFDGGGAASIIDGWMNVIADEFIQKTRFDPQHAGHTEQQLYDQVSAWLSDPGIVDHRVSVTNEDASRDIEVSAVLLTNKLRQRLSAFDFSAVHRLVLSPRAAQISGLRGLLAEQVAYIDAAQSADLARNCTRLATSLSPSDVRRIVSAEVEATDIDAPVAAADTAATHLLREHTAYALSDARFNGHIDLTGTLTPGEELHVDGHNYIAIRLE